MAILRPVIHQKQILGSSDTVGQQIEEGLRLLIDPMQVFEDDDCRLFETFPEDDALDRLEYPLPADRGIHLRQGIGTFLDPEEPEQVWRCIGQRGIERG